MLLPSEKVSSAWESAVVFTREPCDKTMPSEPCCQFVTAEFCTSTLPLSILRVHGAARAGVGGARPNPTSCQMPAAIARSKTIVTVAANFLDPVILCHSFCQAMII